MLTDHVWQNRALERSHQAHAEAMAAAKAEADDYQRGLSDRARSKFSASNSGQGLVIHRAIYGVMPLRRGVGVGEELGSAGAADFESSDGASLLDRPLEPEPEPEPDGTAPADGGGGGCWYDVTTALQLKVEDKGRRGVGYKLRIETDTDFAELLGFADPCMGVKKQLRVAYSWRGRHFLATIDDKQTFTLPNEAHRLTQ